MDMSLVSHEQMPERSVSTLKEEWSAQPVLKPEQVRAGVNTMMTHEQRIKFWKNSPFAERFGFVKKSQPSEN
jgi:hypothetical protein